MGCLAGCLRLLLGTFWRALLAALAAVLFAQVDRYVERRYGATRAGRLYLRARRGSREGARPGPV